MAKGICKKVIDTTEFLITSLAPNSGVLKKYLPNTSIKIITANKITHDAETTCILSESFIIALESLTI